MYFGTLFICLLLLDLLHVVGKLRVECLRVECLEAGCLGVECLGPFGNLGAGCLGWAGYCYRWRYEY